MAIATVNPATGEQLRSFDALTDEELDLALQRSVDAFDDYRATSFEYRSALLHRAAEILDDEADELGRIATTEMGKTLSAAVAEVHKCAKGCRWFADHAREMLADEPWPIEGARVYTRYEPLGPVLAVMPWNFPYWQVFRFAAPALMAGNVGLLKHASNVPQAARAIEDVLRRAGFPEGVFQTLLIPSSKVDSVIDDDRVRAATLTGSEPAGRQVGATAGRNVKTSVLELGGSDVFIVMPSTDLEDTVSHAVTSRLLNNGQSCINAKRFVVHTDVADEFTRLMVERMETVRVGDPTDSGTDLGPLSSADAVSTLDKQVRDTVAAGGRLLTGGEPLGGRGHYYPPTVLTDIPQGSPAHREEFFGPVALLWRANDVDEAIRIANDSPFGLGGSAWTRDPGEQQRFVTEVETGMMYINRYTESTPEVPFGGAKNSGYGRELARFGPHSFVNAKTVWIAGDEQTGQAVE
ncbi:succinate-semialdehyde dehydrogenase/glutarate-semialdehyde dehydrogenase [Saccharopolyspora lacisalsi]|uniref:Succinate-semialdehyde dehydrogenase/glutarate-semialdehyde dehydrogenase n=1 Tax=Halosaccharopolyspora lacisalsi TaxID=1000566 RepID=A0A839DV82_9PSEU|nr:NAD-dependent succinate-semialdehyde dehydrogenase [Halosaccharopolyspora lacisalsi]MBA8824953.1 succinate-semialdehyde dehydrogenase/glutarate-semialdehyde dehydrogenase [Halosaccharopolyspora lacisalsi]